MYFKGFFETKTLNKYSTENIMTHKNSKVFSSLMVLLELSGKVSIVKAKSDNKINT